MTDARPVPDPTRSLAAASAAVVAGGLLTAGPAAGRARATEKVPTAVGRGGAVSTVDPEATRAGLRVLRRGGNAVDAAVAAAATLGVTEPYSAGIGGGGFLVYYDAQVAQGAAPSTAARQRPASTTADTYRGIPFTEAVTSGLSVGVPGTPADLAEGAAPVGDDLAAPALRPATRVATRGFVVDETFRDQTAGNEERFRDIVPTRELFLPGGELPAVGSVFRNPDLARTYRKLGRKGVRWLYDGRLARDIVRTVAHPPVDPAATRTVRPGLMTRPRPGALPRAAAAADVGRLPRADRQGHGPAVQRRLDGRRGAEHPGEHRPGGHLAHRPHPGPRTSTSRPARSPSPTAAATSATRAPWSPASCARSCRSPSPTSASARSTRCRPHPSRCRPGRPTAATTPTATAPTTRRVRARPGREGLSTTHLTTADRWGNVVSYTLTIEQTGGSAITVPNRGFLLNNELTDFSLDPVAGDPNAPGPGKRPRSSMSPDDRARRQASGARARIARWLDDHHHRAAGPAEPAGLRDDAARGGRRAAREPAQHRVGAGRAGLRPDAAVGGARAQLHRRGRASAPSPASSSTVVDGWSPRPSRPVAAGAARGWSTRAADRRTVPTLGR